MRALTSRLWTVAFGAFSALGSTASGAGATSADLKALIEQHHCDIVERLDQIRATPLRGEGRDRFLIVTDGWNPGHFVQCIFFDNDQKMLCEAASGFFQSQGRPRRFTTTAEGRNKLAELGFSVDDSAGNFALKLEVSDANAHGKVSEIMVHALHGAFNVGLATPLLFDAPRARDRNRIAARCRTVG